MSNQERDRDTHSGPSELLDPDQNRFGKRRVWTPIIILLAVGLMTSIAFGFFQQNNLDGLPFGLVLRKQKQSVVLTEGNEASVVMMINSGDRQEVRILNTDTYVVEDASRGMSNASQPALSSSGTKLAYLIQRRGSAEIDIYELGGTSTTLIPAKELSLLAEQMGFEELAICPWSSLGWSKADRYLAFFICVDDFSLLAAKDLSQDKTITLDFTKANKTYERTFSWISGKQLAVVQPDKSHDTVWIVDIESHQRQKVFGR